MNFNYKNIIAGIAIVTAGFAACSQPQKNTLQAGATADTTQKNISTDFAIPSAANFEETIDGKPVHLFYLKNKNGAEAAITNFGGRLVSLRVPDRQGKMTDVVVGFNSLKDYQRAGSFYGASIGRYGNRIARGTFTLAGNTYTLPINNGKNTLHGGKAGFDSHIWDAKMLNGQSVQLSLISPDGDQGFPGKMNVKVTYTLQDNNSLKISYEATTDKPTVVNLTNHTYWNLNGCGSGSILNHTLQISADKFTPVDRTLIPTGQLPLVAGTPFDFRKPNTIGARINNANEQLKNGKGYDHNFVLNPHDMNIPVATATGDKSGIIMQVYTQEPGLQFYSGNFMKGANTVKGGGSDGYRNGFCLETQHFPDSPNRPNFPSTELKPGQVYKTETIYKFTVSK